MASATTELKIKVLAPGAERLPGLARSFQRFGDDVKKAGFSVSKLSAELKKQRNENTKSINNTRALANTWKELAASVEFGSKEFREATAEAQRLNAELNKMQSAGGRGRRSLTGAVKTAGAIAGAGVFGGPEGAVGAAIGGLMPGGDAATALVGGAIGAQVGMVRKELASIAEFSASLQLQRKALLGIIGDLDQYRESLEFVEQTSARLAIPQDILTRQFTQLTASVTGAGLSVEDAERAFVAVAAGIRGTGGSLEDMRSALVATSQVFSKGKVSAEELRQQLGERLPGAFTLFAESMGKTPAELDKLLEQGKVTLDDFMGFADELTARYGDLAEDLAQSLVAAGDRMKTQMAVFKDLFGQLLIPIGAVLQELIISLLESINQILKGVMDNGPVIVTLLKNVLSLTAGIAVTWATIAVAASWASIITALQTVWKLLIGIQGVLTGVVALQAVLNAVTKNWVGLVAGAVAFAATYKALDDITKTLTEKMKALSETMNTDVVDSVTNVGSAISKLGDATRQTSEEFTVAFAKKFGAYVNDVKNFGDQAATAVVNAFQKMEDALVGFVKTGKLSFTELANSIISDMIRIAIRQTVTLPMLGGFTNLFQSAFNFGSGDGSSFPFSVSDFNSYPGIFQQGGSSVFPGNAESLLNLNPDDYLGTSVGAFADGGFVGAGRTVLVGERGPELWSPMSSGHIIPNNQLGRSSSVVVNVDASGSSVEGNQGEANQLGQILGAVVQAELIKQKRPGGLLAV